ncbi:ligase-associated DNA damage response endonuclease PdeM [Asticcacaulis sp. 201]|uniref:ligase-associated DNA damage response endonuclease PdeM n=1 Tax=Asticcacaulis sp. 201 TaxID=3028787 RepID=UPI002916ED53|nr:ligase-associated DNA damage response endonuclease PdeM [Asticcacaulis sp. 201]MDV6331267.1 ligase-associated DNA damage response endonuclease PdeM [Asticcacaulis sp. 201]
MPSRCEIDFAGQRFVLDAGLGLYWPAQEALVVSDLHLEKASFLAQFGSAVAPYDTLDTLLRLEKLVATYRPKSLILLGDSFHDRKAWTRLEEAARHQLLAICGAVDTCHLVEGNHDLGLLGSGNLNFTADVEISGIAFRHEPHSTDLPQIVGHFHPKLRTSLRGHRLSGKVFAVNNKLLIMPAFGTFTGGLDLGHEAFIQLAGNNPFRAYMAYKDTVAGIPRNDL